VVCGSRTRTNPLYDLAYKIEASIKDDERQLGIGPLSRFRLGAEFSSGAKSLAELNAETENGDDAAADPRVFRLPEYGRPQR
jgi:hypothetical protein